MFGKKKSDEPKVSHARKKLGPHLWSRPEPDPFAAQALAPGAMFALSWKWYHDEVMGIPGAGRSESAAVSEARKGLADSWGVVDERGAMNTLQSLLNGMHNPLYEIVTPFVLSELNSGLHGKDAKAFKKSNEEQIRAIARANGAPDDQLLRPYKAWHDSFFAGMRSSLDLPEGDIVLPEHVIAWDLTRATFIARLSYTAGYIPGETAGQVIQGAHDMLTDVYSDWHQVSRGHLVGFAFWASQAYGLSAGTHLYGRKETLDALFEPDGPWGRFPLAPLPHTDDPVD